jgi:two-component sensor histidine kinase
MTGNAVASRRKRALEPTASSYLSLRFWLVVLIATLALPLITLVVFTTIREHTNANRRLEHQLQLQAGALSMAIDGDLASAAVMAETLAASTSLADDNLTAFRAEMDAAVTRSPGIYISLADRYGMQRLLTMMPPGSYPPADTPASAMTLPVLLSGRTQFSNLYRGALTQIFLVAVAAPVTRPNGVVTGVVSVGFPQTRFDEILGRQQLPEGWVATLFDRDHKIVARSTRADEFVGRAASTLLIDEVKQRPSGVIRLTRLDGVPSAVVYARGRNSGFMVGIGVPTANFSMPLQNALLKLAAFSAALTLGGLGAAIWLGNRIAGAIEGLLSPENRQVSTLRFREVEAIAKHLASQKNLRDSLVAELNHRVKNTLMTVQSLASLSLRGSSKDLVQTRQDFLDRVAALSRSHDILAKHGWKNVAVEQVWKQAGAPWQADHGAVFMVDPMPPIALSPRQAQAVIIALHELASNAVRYGALSQSAGRVRVQCTRLENGMASLRWTESGGPILPGPPAYTGLGLKVLERVIPRDLGSGGAVTVAFNTTGVDAVLFFRPAG